MSETRIPPIRCYGAQGILREDWIESSVSTTGCGRSVGCMYALSSKVEKGSPSDVFGPDFPVNIVLCGAEDGDFQQLIQLSSLDGKPLTVENLRNRLRSRGNKPLCIHAHPHSAG